MKTIQAHFIHEQRGMFSQFRIEHAPSVGDELRFSGERYFRVTRLVWVYDENGPCQRLNIGMVDAGQSAQEVE